MPFECFGPEALDSIVNVRLTKYERERLKEEADVAGLSVSALVRRRIFGRPVIASVDLAMIRELRRIGGLAKHIYLDSERKYSIKTANILEEVQKFIAQLSQDYDDRKKGKKSQEVIE
jgi:hypothetical protein